MEDEDRDELFSISTLDNYCKICAAEFIDDEELKHHILRTHTNDYSLTRFCSFCNTFLPSIEDYAKHILIKHLDFQCCEFCCRIFNNADKFQLHIVKHRRLKELGKFVYSCSQCPELFHDIDDLVKHEGIHDNYEGVMLLNCMPHLTSILHMKCQSFFNSLGKKHRYICMNCKFKTLKPNLYLKHLEYNHKKCYVCNECSSPFKNKELLKIHLKKYFEKRETKMCRFCKESFNTNILLNHEINCKFINTYKCKICDFIGDSIVEITDHQVQAHPATVSIVVCNYCRKDCPGEVAYQQHKKRTHDPYLHLYKYNCLKCNQFFNHPKNLFAHFFSCHKDLEPYTCRICDKKFKLRKTFTIHIKMVHKSIGFVEFDDNFHVYFGNAKKDTVLNDHDYLVQEEFTIKENKDETTSADEQTDTKSIQDTEKQSITKNINADTDDQSDITTKNLGIAKNKKPKSKKPIPKVSKNLNKILLDIRKRNAKKPLQLDLTTSSDDDDKPLIQVKNKKRNNKCLLKKKIIPKDFTCRNCNKKCYTYNNYKNHIRIHINKTIKQCKKCGMVFKKSHDLQKHMTLMHDPSKLRDTLKKVIERRSRENKINGKKITEISMPIFDIQTNQPKLDDKTPELIENTDLKEKKIKLDNFPLQTATIRDMTPEPVEYTKLKVKKLKLDNFPLESATIRDITNCKTNNVKTYLETFRSDVDNKSSDTLKIIRTHKISKQTIQLTPINLQTPEFTNLSMPVKFQQCYQDFEKAQLRVLLAPDTIANKISFVLTEKYPEISITEQDYFDDDAINNDNTLPTNETKGLYSHTELMAIPEVGQEVFVEEKEMKKVREIVLPECAAKSEDLKQVAIGYLLNKAPFYKVVKVKALLNKPKYTKRTKKIIESNFRVPQNIKLVNVNPLEHLLKGKNIEEVDDNKSKEDYKKLLAKALIDLKSQELAKKTSGKVTKHDNEE